MASVKEKARAALPQTTSAAWGHVVGVGVLLIVVVVVPPWPEAFAMPKAMLLTALAFSLIPLIWLRKAGIRVNRVPVMLAGSFVGLALVSQFLAGAPLTISLWGEWSRRAGTLTIVALGLIFVGISLLTRREIRTALAWLVWSGVPAAAYGLVQLVGADPFNWNNEGWLVSTFGNPNFAAAGLSMLALLTAGLALTRTYGSTWRLLMAPLAAVEALLALQTGSSQAIFALAAGVGAGAVVWLLRWDDVRRLPALIGVAILGAVGLVLTLMALFGSGPLVPVISSDTLMFRKWYWGAALGMASSHPIFGVGPDGYGRFYGEFRPVEAAQLAEGASAAHSVPLQWAATLGIPAGLVYLALIVSVAALVLHRLWRQGPSGPALALPLFAAWSAYQVQSLVSIDAINIAALGWLVSGAVLAVTAGVDPIVSTSRAMWAAATGLAIAGALLWIAPLQASNSSRDVTLVTSPSTVTQAVALVEGTMLPCEASTGVARWMFSVAPSAETVGAVYAGATTDPRCYGLVNGAASFALQLQDADRATAFARQGTMIDPHNYMQWVLLAQAHLLAGDSAAAAEALSKAVQLAPGAPEVLELKDQLAVESIAEP